MIATILHAMWLLVLAVVFFAFGNRQRFTDTYMDATCLLVGSVKHLSSKDTSK